MKRILLALALLCTLQLAQAQKSDADVRKAVDKALAASQDAKKAEKPATWLNLGKAYLSAYSNPVSNMAQGVDHATFALMFKEQPSATEDVTVDGQPFVKYIYSHVNVYFNAQDQLVFWDITKASIDEEPLAEAANAYAKAYSLGAKEKDVAPKLKEIVDSYYNDAFTAYSVGDLARASRFFKGAADVSVIPPCTERNDDAFYNTAFTALAVQDYDTALEYYKKCLDFDYTQDGNVYASISEVCLAKADTLAAKNYLATGLTRYPDNASVLTNLINLYINTNEDPVKIVELLDEAKKAMPDNASLYYVEGNIYAGIKKYDEAIAAYEEALKIQPGYDMAYYGEGIVEIKIGEDLVDEMNALDFKEWKKFDELKLQLNAHYDNAIGYFEKAYDSAGSPEVKLASADFLKRLNFQLRGEDPKYQEAYDKWNAIVNQ